MTTSAVIRVILPRGWRNFADAQFKIDLYWSCANGLPPKSWLKCVYLGTAWFDLGKKIQLVLSGNWALKWLARRQNRRRRFACPEAAGDLYGAGNGPQESLAP